MTGKCNMILCGDITDDTVSLIKQRQRNKYTSLIIEEGKFIVIHADHDVVDIVRRESPDSDVDWSYNGIFIYSDDDDDRIVIENYNISEYNLNNSLNYFIKSFKKSIFLNLISCFFLFCF